MRKKWPYIENASEFLKGQVVLENKRSFMKGHNTGASVMASYLT